MDRLNILNKLPKAVPVEALIQLIKAAQKEAEAEDLHLKELALKFSYAHIITVSSHYGVVMSVCIPRHVEKDVAAYEKMFCELVRAFVFNMAIQRASLKDAKRAADTQREPLNVVERAVTPKEIIAACHLEIETWKREYRR
ncbi:MAG: hypothetical protein WC479_08265 [Candidatus Izemoplasmatales bacterium]